MEEKIKKLTKFKVIEEYRSIRYFYKSQHESIFGESVTILGMVVDGKVKPNFLVEFNNEYKHLQIISRDMLSKKRFGSPYKKSVFGVGFMGVGKYGRTKNHKIYNIWHNKLRVAFSSYYNKDKEIPRTQLEKKFHNFQVFAEWYENNKDNNYNNQKIMRDYENKNFYPGSIHINNQGLEAIVLGRVWSENKKRILYLIEFILDKARITANGFQLKEHRFKNPMHPSVHNRGYVGIGPHGSKKDSRCYSLWIAKLRDDKKLNKKFFNFQTFAKHYYSNKEKEVDMFLNNIAI